MGEDAGDLGEFGLIERLLARLQVPEEGVALGPGDDTAAVRTTATTLATADLLLEGTHFDLAFSSPADVGWKALAVNVSDIAAMGGIPRYALVSLGAPSATRLETLEALYDGIAECAEAFGVSIVGGDTVGAAQVILSIALLGEPGPGGVVPRSGGRAGDVVCVTGALGGAAAGLALLRMAHQDPEAMAIAERHPDLVAVHRRPTPRVREGQAAASVGATAMIDVSDGLAADLGHVCDASRLGAELREGSIPTAAGLDEVSRWSGTAATEFALAGGDDYELIVTIPAAQLSALSEAIAPTKVTPIGELVGEGRVLLSSDGTRYRLEGGWDHFGGTA